MLGTKLVVTRIYGMCGEYGRISSASGRSSGSDEPDGSYPKMVIILAWIIRGERKYDRSPPVRPCAGIVFRAGPRKSDELIERAIIGRLKTVTRRAVAVELPREVENMLSNFQYPISV